ncbi:hypothetical protein [Ruminococcus sp.]|nr:hypothetical protein [Ruminococcus sp.]MEE1262307.1 hypothetical protein [Ruminococcus sp.]
MFELKTDRLGDGVWKIGCHIGAKYTKRGYATEAVKAFMPVIKN